jgi:hypothetical protein
MNDQRNASITGRGNATAKPFRKFSGSCGIAAHFDNPSRLELETPGARDCCAVRAVPGDSNLLELARLDEIARREHEPFDSLVAREGVDDFG